MGLRAWLTGQTKKNDGAKSAPAKTDGAAPAKAETTENESTTAPGLVPSGDDAGTQENKPNTETDDMASDQKNDTSSTNQNSTTPPTPPSAPTGPSNADAVAAERERVKQINATFKGDSAFCDEAIENGWSLSDAKGHKFDRDQAARDEAAKKETLLGGAGKSNNRAPFSTTEGGTRSPASGRRAATSAADVAPVMGADQTGDEGPIEGAQNFDHAVHGYMQRGFKRGESLRLAQINHADMWEEKKLELAAEHEAKYPNASKRRRDAFGK